MSATGANKVYDGLTADTVSLGDNRITGDVLTLSNTAASFADKNVANGKAVSVTGINVTGTDAGNYTFNTTAATSANITPATLTYTGTAAGQSYGNGNTTFSGSVGGFVNGETLLSATTGSAAFASGTTATNNVGSYAINGSGLTANNGNYTFVQAAGNSTALTINPAALTVTASNAGKTYGQTPTLTAFTSSGLKNGETIGSATESSTGTAATASVAGGPYAITASAATGGSFSASNYTISYVNGQLTVTPASLTVTANNQVKVFDSADPTLTYTNSVLASGDTISSVLSGSLTRASGVNAGLYNITQGSLASNSNYSMTYVPGTLKIVPLVLVQSSPSTTTASQLPSVEAGMPMMPYAAIEHQQYQVPGLEKPVSEHKHKKDDSEHLVTKESITGLPIMIVDSGMKMPAGWLGN